MSLSAAGQLHGAIGLGGGSRGNNSKLVKFGNGELMGKKIILAQAGVSGGSLGRSKNANTKQGIRMSLTADFAADSK
ncbi:hypothetical protein CRG98_042156, partial [Punica granatum]